MLPGREDTVGVTAKDNRRDDMNLYKKRHKVENMFAKIKDWQRIAMRYDRCAHTFFSAICIAATFIFYLKE